MYKGHKTYEDTLLGQTVNVEPWFEARRVGAQPSRVTAIHRKRLHGTLAEDSSGNIVSKVKTRMTTAFTVHLFCLQKAVFVPCISSLHITMEFLRVTALAIKVFSITMNL